jgi:hypothetical protein
LKHFVAIKSEDKVLEVFLGASNKKVFLGDFDPF